MKVLLLSHRLEQRNKQHTDTKNVTCPFPWIIFTFSVINQQPEIETHQEDQVKFSIPFILFLTGYFTLLLFWQEIHNIQTA